MLDMQAGAEAVLLDKKLAGRRKGSPNAAVRILPEDVCCKYCESTDVYWLNVDNRWRLMSNVDNKPHRCEQYNVRRKGSINYNKNEDVKEM